MHDYRFPLEKPLCKLCNFFGIIWFGAMYHLARAKSPHANQITQFYDVTSNLIGITDDLGITVIYIEAR